MARNLAVAPKAISVGIDGSDSALDAARWAARYAARVGAPLRLVHAVVVPDWLGSFISSPASHTDTLSHEMHVRGEHLLATAVGAADLSAPGSAITTQVVHGSVADVLESESHHAQTVVIGFRSTGLARDLALGRNATKVVNRSTCPIVLHRGATGAGDETVIVGVDGSDNADTALVRAMEYADTMNRPLTVVHTFRVSSLTLIEMNSGFLDWDRFLAAREHWLGRHIEPICSKFPDVSVTTVCRDADPANSLMSLAGSDDVIVVGARGLNRVAGTILGSVSQNLVHHAESSVMVVR